MLSIQPTPSSAAAVSRGLATALLLIVVLATSTGCRLCCDPETEAFPAYGGAWERTNRTSGRVGSTFDPGGARIGSFTPRETANQVDLLDTDRLQENQGDEDAPPNETEPDDGTEGNAETDSEAADREAERERKFQERLKSFEERQLEDIDVIPGTPLPPDVF